MENKKNDLFVIYIIVPFDIYILSSIIIRCFQKTAVIVSATEDGLLGNME